jgi:hypothetical protein
MLIANYALTKIIISCKPYLVSVHKVPLPSLRLVYRQALFSVSKKTPVFLGVLDKKASSARRAMTEKQEFTFRK